MRRFKVCMTVAAMVLATNIADAEEKPVVLKVSHFQTSSSNFHQKVLIPWCDKISKESGGMLKCQIYPSMQLGGTPMQLVEQVRDGVADIISAVPTYQAGRFTKSEVFELPFMVSNAEKGSPALWEYIQRNALDEFKGTRLLFVNLHDGAQLHFGNKSVKVLEDFKGLKVRAPNRYGTKALNLLGAIPVQLPASAVPESVSKNVVDGTSLPWETMTAYKMQEICKTHTETPPGYGKISNALFIFAMNPAKYNSLSPELRKVIDQNSGLETSKWAGRVWDMGTEPARQIAQKRHNVINVLSDAEYSRWVKVTEPVFEDWIKDVNAKGANGKALLSEARALLKKYDK